MLVERIFEFAMILDRVVPHSIIKPFALVPLNTFGICKKSVGLCSLANVSPLDCNSRLSNIDMDDQGHIEDEDQTPDIADLNLPSISKSRRQPPQKRDYMVQLAPMLRAVH